MKKAVTLLFMLLGCCLGARAQVFIFNDNMFQERMSEIRATVLDSLTNEPVAFASVYVVPSKDTTITNFTLTDAKGEAKLDEVPYGSYVFHVEMMGYKPFIKEKYFRDSRVDLGTIKLQVDEQFLQAATITDVGNPIVVKKDTVEFNASSFRVGANAMLKDLLQRMPGMEVTEDGKVLFNGEEIDKLTVGGRTFFFKDQSTALNNLPAAVVDKIRVIDRESESTRATGVEDGEREKVLDVALKKEYQKGWFGNVGLKGGATAGKKEGDDVLRDNRGLLYSGNALVSAYSEKDQLTLIGNVQNCDDGNMVFTMIEADGEISSSLDQGLSTAAQLGLNVNTTRIKDVETTVSVNYKYTDTDSGTKANRTTHQDDGDLLSSTENRGKQYANSLSANLEMQKEEGKVWFHFRPGIRYSKSDSYTSGLSETSREGVSLNKSENATHANLVMKNADLDGDLTFRDLWGKDRRTLRLSYSLYHAAGPSEREETTALTTAAGKEIRTMRYQGNENATALAAGLRYTEPIGEKWTLSAMEALTYSFSDEVKDAFDQAGRNDFYSSAGKTNYWSHETDLTLQYKFGEDSWVTLGGRLMGVLNETYTKSYGIEETVGKDEWNWFVTPALRFQHSVGNDRFTASAFGFSPMPNAAKMRPVLDISNPARLSAGNVYLKPNAVTYFDADWTRNNKEKFSTLMVYFFGQMNSAPISNALWYDASGILYAVPVNATRPSLTARLSGNYTFPLDAQKNWSLTLSGGVSYASSTSFQAKGILPGLDKDNFDYSAFMADFWGDASGNRFYGGKSGFAESVTRALNPSARFSVKYNQDRFSFTLNAGTNGHIARYSLNPAINMNTLDSRVGASGTYTTRHEFEFDTDLSYAFYNGYAEGYGQPEWRWNAEISKNIGAFNLSVKVHDILNQTRNLTHTVTANYEEDSYRLVMGRYVLFGVKWNFGKMNATHSMRAQDAAMNMVFY